MDGRNAVAGSLQVYIAVYYIYMCVRACMRACVRVFVVYVLHKVAKSSTAVDLVGRGSVGRSIERTRVRILLLPQFIQLYK